MALYKLYAYLIKLWRRCFYLVGNTQAHMENYLNILTLISVKIYLNDNNFCFVKRGVSIMVAYSLDISQVLLAAIVAVLLAIALSLKALFAIERRLFRMDENLIKLTSRILREEDEIEVILDKPTKASAKASSSKTSPSKTSKKKSSKAKSSKRKK